MTKAMIEGETFINLDVREKYLIGQALNIAISKLEKQQEPYRQEYHLEQMKELRTSFPCIDMGQFMNT